METAPTAPSPTGPPGDSVEPQAEPRTDALSAEERPLVDPLLSPPPRGQASLTPSYPNPSGPGANTCSPPDGPLSPSVTDLLRTCAAAQAAYPPATGQPPPPSLWRPARSSSRPPAPDDRPTAPSSRPGSVPTPARAQPSVDNCRDS